MKKFFVVLLLFGLSFGLHSQEDINHGWMNEVLFLQGRLPWYEAVKRGVTKEGIVLGAGAGGLGSSVTGEILKRRGLTENKSFIREQGSAMAAGAGAAAGVGTAIEVTKKKWIQFRINQALRKHGAIAWGDFQELTPEQAAFVYATYTRNLARMKQAMRLSGVIFYLIQSGVLPAMAELYFSESSPERISELKQKLNFPTDLKIEVVSEL